MAAPDTFSIVAVVSDREGGAIKEAAQQLSSCLAQAVGHELQVRLQSVARDTAEYPAANVLVASLAGDVTSSDDLDAVERSWRDRLVRMESAGHERVILCTLFRRASQEEGREQTLERIRRLNQLIVTLSHEVGSEIADVDRLLALFGGRVLDADYRCLSKPAARIAGQVIAAAILEGELGCDVSPEAQQRAISIHGGVHNLWQITKRYAGKGAAG